MIDLPHEKTLKLDKIRMFKFWNSDFIGLVWLNLSPKPRRQRKSVDNENENENETL